MPTRSPRRSSATRSNRDPRPLSLCRARWRPDGCPQPARHRRRLRSKARSPHNRTGSARHRRPARVRDGRGVRLPRAAEVLRQAEPAGSELLIDREPLTCERIKSAIRVAITEQGGVAGDMIDAHVRRRRPRRRSSGTGTRSAAKCSSGPSKPCAPASAEGLSTSSRAICFRSTAAPRSSRSRRARSCATASSTRSATESGCNRTGRRTWAGQRPTSGAERLTDFPYDLEL
jgi:hypothetical protein